jgi:GR25 family glycosyltransferase involved in LPS biosynthesis
MEFVDCIYYINLDHRQDRKEQLLQELAPFELPPEKLVRVPAVYTKDHGALGCGLSHCHALSLFLESNHKTCLIFEDDFMFTQPYDTINSVLEKASTLPFDIILLASNTLAEKSTEWPFLTKIISAQTTSAYWISREFAPRLLDCFQRACAAQQEYLNRVHSTNHQFCIDQAWKELQSKSRWYCFSPKVGCQRESYSDIENKVTKYGV